MFDIVEISDVDRQPTMCFNIPIEITFMYSIKTKTRKAANLEGYITSLSHLDSMGTKGAYILCYKKYNVFYFSIYAVHKYTVYKETQRLINHMCQCECDY